MTSFDRATAVGLELVNLLLGCWLRGRCGFFAIKDGQARTSKPFSDNTEGLAYANWLPKWGAQRNII